jgi:hypothetical protein
LNQQAYAVATLATAGKKADLQSIAVFIGECSIESFSERLLDTWQTDTLPPRYFKKPLNLKGFLFFRAGLLIPVASPG